MKRSERVRGRVRVKRRERVHGTARVKRRERVHERARAKRRLRGTWPVWTRWAGRSRRGSWDG